MLLFLGYNLSLLRKSEETLLFGRNADFTEVNPDCKILLTAAGKQSK
jgi:hypothetical protein